VIHALETRKPWQDGPVSTFIRSPYYSVAQEILATEANPGTETKVGGPWYTAIPTDFVRLRDKTLPLLPHFEQDDQGIWVEKKANEP
jgi:hypothetical protein